MGIERIGFSHIVSEDNALVNLPNATRTMLTSLYDEGHLNIKPSTAEAWFTKNGKGEDVYELRVNFEPVVN